MISNAPGYQQKFRPKIQFSKLFEINLKLYKYCTRGCIYDINNKILQKKMFFGSPASLLRSTNFFCFPGIFAK